jgi:phenylalanyl-tRNA synthetase beta chain
MQFSEAWLRSLVDPDLTTAELGHLLTMAGLEVEAMEPAAPVFNAVLVAEILTAERHPDADRLQVCTVNVGQGDPLRIVCGAANARAGLKTACAQVGAVLPGDFRIKQAKVRGVESAGMLCSAKELGIAAQAEGILELPADAPVGASLRDYLGLDDQRITLKLTPNRGDCLSIQGIAREVAAITGAPLAPVACDPMPASIDDQLPVRIEAPEACPRYCGRVIRGIDPATRTPDWMTRRLERSGLRPIHPVVDVTNYVLLELGQPMHGFDLARLAGGIRARMAVAGEKLVLLNEQSIELDEQSLVIADDSGPLALAGIMGGASSAVTDATRDIFLEAAHFAPDAIAGRARAYGLGTDSSHRFERGVDPNLPARAMERATRLILDICGGAAGLLRETVGRPTPNASIAFRPQRARRILGLDLADADILALLRRLGLDVSSGGETWTVTAPTYRFDLTLEVDLIEEVARLHGYDAIPAAAPRAGASMRPAGERERTVTEVKTRLTSMGYQEVITYSFISEELQADLGGGSGRIALLNPIASQMSVMRGSLLPGLLATLNHNLNHGQERLRIFELGRCFSGMEPDRQPLRLAGLCHGNVRPEQWADVARRVDFFDAKGDLEALLAPRALIFIADTHPSLHPGQCARMQLDGRDVGWLGSLHPTLVQKYDLGAAPVLFELDWAAIAARDLPAFQPIPRLPAVRRDLAVLVEEGVRVGDMLNTVRPALPVLITDFRLFDVYRGQGVKDGKKSVAFSMLLQHTEKTLTEAEIEAAVARVLDLLTTHYQARLRV